MKLFAKTLTDFLIETIRPVIMGNTGGQDLRIFLSSQPPKIIYETANEISEFLHEHPSIQFEFKVGTALWETWNQTSLSQYDKSCVEKIKKNGWVDIEDKLTHYRNLKWSPESRYDYLVIILVGVDLARDQASLQDFFTVDSNSIWDVALNKNFKSWIRQTFQDQRESVFSQDEHVEAADELLKVLHKNGAGDLLQVSDFLGQLDLNGLPDGNAALMAMYWGLNFWDLPKLQEMSFSSRNKWTDYVKDARRFFSYQDLLNNAERQNVLKKIDSFNVRCQQGQEDYPLADDEEFVDLPDLLSCLQKYVASNSLSSRSRLLNTDFAPIRDRILKVRTRRPGPTSPAMVKINAPPLEAVLSALWRVLIDFKKACTKENILPAAALRKISLEGIKFRHDDDGLELIKGCLGGLDNFLEKNLIIDVAVDEEKANIPIKSKLLPDDLETLRIEKAGASSPGFQFKIVFQTEPDDLTIERKFQWQLPETQAYRNLWNLTKEVRRQLPDVGACLPVFTMPHYEELFLASDEEEANRILKLGHEGLEVINLLDLEQINTNDPLFSKLGDLSHYWGKFLEALHEDGYFHALGEPWGKFSRTYREILQALVRDEHIGPKNQFAPLLYKAFSIISNDELKSPFTEFLQSAVLTGLHPALLEMLQNRETFLIHGFLEKSREIIKDSSGLKITLQHWDNVCDLATIKFPLFCLVADASKNIDTNIKSLGLIHCVGSPTQKSSPLSAKIILRSDENDDEEMSDANLFRESKESRVIKRLLDEYVEIYPHAKDGLSLAVINAENVQTIIAGIDEFLKNRLDYIDQLSPPYHFSLTLFTLDNHQQEATKHLQEWRRRWEVVNDATSKFGYYHNCRLSIAHRIANNVNLGIDDYLKLASRHDFEVDLAILANFITVGDKGNDIEITDTFQHILDDHLLKFPIVEMPRCSDEHPSKIYVRAKVVSNRRFRLATLHSELGAYFKHPGYPVGDEYIVISEGDYDRWRHLIDKLHERATWVFCLDSAMDELLASGQDGASSKKRGIIGFSSGLGLRGELNYTISTERSSLAEIEKKIAKQISGLCSIKEQNILEQSARFLVSKASKLSGLSLVRATGPGERHIRELIASTLVRISLPDIPRHGLCLCDELISLDAFIHWFENAASPNRPDLLRIVAILQDDGVIVVNAHIVECKLAMQSSAHLEKARIQLESGLRHLMTVFQPSYDGAENAVFDQRYWWAQLQRLVASKSRVPSRDQQRVTHALESLGEGNYRICWQAMAVVFWTDSQTTSYRYDRSWEFFYRDRQLAIDVISAGAGIIAPLCSSPGEIILPCSNEVVCFPPDTNFNEPKESKRNNGVFHAPEPQSKNIPSIIGSPSASDKIPSSNDTLKLKPSPSETSFLSEDRKETPEDKLISPDLETGELQPDKIEKQNIPSRIFLGQTIGSVKKEIFWEYGHPQLTNRHFLIFGKSGVGKTYAIQCILMEFARQNQNTAIVDYTSGFLKSRLEHEFKDTVNPTGHIVKQSPLPLNPFRKQRIIIDEDYEDVEDAYSVAGRITSVFTSVYSSFGEQQKALLHKVIEQGIESQEDGYDFGRLLEDLEIEGSTIAINVANKLTPLGRAKLFSGCEENSWKQIYSDSHSRVNIFQLAGLPRDLSIMATEFILWDLYDYASNQGKEERPLPIVLDEIQNLDHSLNAPLSKMLTEGRKFGISAILATQTLSNLPQEARDRLFMATHKLFFKPAETELKEYATILANITGDKLDIWKERLVKLNKGECYSIGPALNIRSEVIEERAYPITITSLLERIKRTENNG